MKVIILRLCGFISTKSLLSFENREIFEKTLKKKYFWKVVIILLVVIVVSKVVLPWVVIHILSIFLLKGWHDLGGSLSILEGKDVVHLLEKEGETCCGDVCSINQTNLITFFRFDFCLYVKTKSLLKSSMWFKINF